MKYLYGIFSQSSKLHSLRLLINNRNSRILAIPINTRKSATKIENQQTSKKQTGNKNRVRKTSAKGHLTNQYCFKNAVRTAWCLLNILLACLLIMNEEFCLSRPWLCSSVHVSLWARASVQVCLCVRKWQRREIGGQNVINSVLSLSHTHTCLWSYLWKSCSHFVTCGPVRF